MSPAPITVSALSLQVRRCLEGQFPLLWVSGEVSNLTRASSGHVYFSLKDESAQMRCVMFRNRVQLVPWQLANGQQIEINARVSFYEPRGDFQLTVESMRQAGLGRLYEAFARLRQALEAEGLFGSARKQAIPRYPHCVGVISSPRTAALQDVLVTLRRRAPHLPVVVFPATVQGIDAAANIAAALTAAQQYGHCDALLLVRGGGSIEDLWSFNEEATVRAIAACRIPLITGIGHETDLTLADLAADQRATTPTASAELLTTHWYAAASTLGQLEQALRRAMTRPIEQFRQRLDMVTAQLIHPRERIARTRERLAHLGKHLESTLRYRLTAHQHRLTQVAHRFSNQRPQLGTSEQELKQLNRRLNLAMKETTDRKLHQMERLRHALELLSPHQTLARGYAVVRTRNGAVAMSPTDLPGGMPFSVQLAQGQLQAMPIADGPKPD